MNNFQKYYKKSLRVVIATFLIYAVLVSTHLGEFWPFSIYPMFSQAGNPWKRAIVRDVTNIEQDSLWKNFNHQNLVGNPLPLDKLNINTNDIANYLSKTEVWTPGKINGVRKLFSEELDSRNILLLQAKGSLNRQDSVIVEFIPFIFLTQDTTILNNELKTE